MGDIAAAILAVERMPLDAPLHLICTTGFLPNALIAKLEEWEDKAWLNIENAPFVYTLVGKLRRRCAVTTIKKAKGRDWKHINDARLEWKTRRREADPTLTRKIRAGVDDEFNLTGMRISNITQARAYAGIQAINLRSRPRTERRIAETQAHITEISADKPPAREIWLNLRHRDIRPTVADFLWKTMHDAHRCGAFWTKIPRYEDRGTCQVCHVEDSIGHILTQCQAPGQSIIWRLTEKLWRRKNLAWPGVTLEAILSAPLRTWTKDGEKKKQEGATRLWRILLTESAFLIWKIRCERVIGHDDDENWTHTRKEIENRWMAAITARMRADVTSTHWRNGSLAVKKSRVHSTWHDVLEGAERLPEDWIKKRVLVGIAPVNEEEPD
ncbi:hypothetical protein FOMPIDRAFT_1136670 [Fomitopsis schrenkii]|uniref:Reverse transcriptase zinc-binding domain-containing protein n=1 Tax=Fomitopsis schrenkii TaxID=2126942 RepID=S8F2R6_FOMSC|nr:hypothetical protein FOMPIDRAFT_1136670 [Fomitopsis schrenkii]